MARIVLLLLLSMAGLATADEGAVPPEEFLYCTTCHGVQLMGNEALGSPRLSGLDAWYVEQQLQAFRSGWRGVHEGDGAGREMRPMAEALDDVQVAKAATYVAASRSPLPERTMGGDPGEGEMFYTTCSTCHGPRGEGNRELGSPALTGLNDWYLADQLRKFQSGVRGVHPDDSYGQQMRAASDILPDDRAIADVVAYITTLNTDTDTGDR